jgi:hypothetical protein
LSVESAFAVSMMIEVLAVCGFRRRRWATSNPSIRGIITSSRTRSGRSAAAFSSACSPSDATETSYPALRRLTSTNRAISGSSSTTRMVSGISQSLRGG